MNRNVILMLLIAASISCNNAPPKTETANDAASQDFAEKEKKRVIIDTAAIEPILLAFDDANTMIYNYHYYRTHILKEQIVSTGFELDVNAIRAYLQDTSIKTLNVYLAKRKDAKDDPVDSTMTLVYIGAFDSTSAENRQTYQVERAFVKGGKAYLLDQANPCPTCIDRVRVYDKQEASKK